MGKNVNKDRYNNNWKTTNENGAKTCIRKNAKGFDREWYWCNKDVHSAPCWCPRKHCRSKADLKEYLKDRSSSKENNSGNAGSGVQENVKENDDFKIALAAMVSAENFKLLEEQFLKNC